MRVSPKRYYTVSYSYIIPRRKHISHPRLVINRVSREVNMTYPTSSVTSDMEPI